MIRKFALAAAAVAALGTASLAVTATPAAAKGPGFHHNHIHAGHFLRGGLRFYGGPAYAAYVDNGCYARRLVETYRGLRVRWVNICY